MNSNQPEIIETKSPINYNYATTRITQSRLNKGLLAIPVSLADRWFPDINTTIKVYLGNSDTMQPHTYSSYQSTTREARIGGLSQWFQQTRLKDGDEIVVQLIEKENQVYRLVPEKQFISRAKGLQKELENAEDEDDASTKFSSLARWVGLAENQLAITEYHRLVNEALPTPRDKVEKPAVCVNETTPGSIRVLLEHIYGGHCQVCDFFFLKRTGKPYFEIHHIDPSSAHHPKNLVLVCANCHRQFAYAKIAEFFTDGWLTKVSFNDKNYRLNQSILKAKLPHNLKQLFLDYPDYTTEGQFHDQTR